ncbi:MAG TPA: hypothetical protein VMH32_24510 [Burkholderiales bacterium]|nr:hypothetical protein [Burkholderiales bacterium]
MFQFKFRSQRLFAAGSRLLAMLVISLALNIPSAVLADEDRGHHSRQPDFGPNVLIFDPTMPISEIEATVNAIYAQQVHNEFGAQRFTLLFKPGTYGSPDQPIIFKVGYYTEVAGLGASPADTVFWGHWDVYNQCLTPGYCVALNNFWRSLSNLTINVAGGQGCRGAGNFWAVSQAAPMRRVNVNGVLTFMDFCPDDEGGGNGPFYASGGYTADSRFSGDVINGSQQQFFTRNSFIGGSWTNGVWNQVFSGVVGAPPQSFSTCTDPACNPYTTLPRTEVSREKPFLHLDASGDYKIFVPALLRNSVGTTWQSGSAAGSDIPIRDFFIASPTDSARKINDALEDGKHLILTPGIYHLGQAIEVKHRNTVVLGMGYATLVPQRGTPAMTIPDEDGVRVAGGLLIDAGPVTSPVLLEIGYDKHDEHGSKHEHGRNHSDNPISLQDVFFRIGGAAAGKATVSLVVNSDDTLLDHLWLWRADHGNGVGWTVNTADTGLVVKGDDVKAYGLFVEHYQKYNVIWNGERGKTVFFQNELPYDPPSQAAWSHDGVNGFAAYKVDDGVRVHETWGMGSYCFVNQGVDIVTDHAFEVPATHGVRLHDTLTVWLNATCSIDHVIDDIGAAVNPANPRTNIVEFP